MSKAIVRSDLAARLDFFHLHVSVSVDLSVERFIFGGRDNISYFIDITLPGGSVVCILETSIFLFFAFIVDGFDDEA